MFYKLYDLSGFNIFVFCRPPSFYVSIFLEIIYVKRSNYSISNLFLLFLILELFLFVSVLSVLFKACKLKLDKYL